MKRSLQEVVELVVFGLIALLIGTGVLWLVGWVLGLVGLLFKVVAGLIWWLLRYIVPVAIVAGLVYFLVRMAQNQGKKQSQPVVPPAAPTIHPPSATSTSGKAGTHDVGGNGPSGTHPAGGSVGSDAGSDADPEIGTSGVAESASGTDDASADAGSSDGDETDEPRA